MTTHRPTDQEAPIMGSIVASPATRAIARQIITDTRWDGADATLRLLPQIRPTQLAALVHLLARAAAAAPPSAATRLPLTMSRDEMRECHNRYNAGHRDDRTRTGEREYQRARMRRARATTTTTEEDPAA